MNPWLWSFPVYITVCLEEQKLIYFVNQWVQKKQRKFWRLQVSFCVLSTGKNELTYWSRGYGERPVSKQKFRVTSFSQTHHMLPENLSTVFLLKVRNSLRVTSFKQTQNMLPKIPSRECFLLKVKNWLRLTSLRRTQHLLLEIPSRECFLLKVEN